MSLNETDIAVILNNLAAPLSSGDPILRAAAIKLRTRVADALAVSKDDITEAARIIAMERTAPRQKPQVSLEEWKANHAPAVWRWLHRELRQHPPSSEKEGRLIIARLMGKTPCPKCRSNFMSHVAANPPRWGEQGFNAFEWSVAIHNAANTELGKPQVPIDEAYKLYPIDATLAK